MSSKKSTMNARRIKVGIISMAAMAIILWLILMSKEIMTGTLSANFFITVIPLIGILALLAAFVKRRETSLKNGMPLTDELSGAIDNKAGRYTVTVTMWFLLASALYQMFIEEFALPNILLRHFIWLVFFLMMLVFVGFKWYLSRKGI